MLSSKFTAIILKRTNFGESDKILTLFSKELGKMSVVAKGVRKIKSKRAPHLEPLNEVEMVVHKGKSYSLVTEVKGLNHPHYQLQSLSYALYALEVIDKLLPDGEQHETIYELLSQLLLNPELDENKIKEFSLQILWSLGYLSRGQYPKIGINSFIEQIAEKRLRSKKLIDEI